MSAIIDIGAGTGNPAVAQQFFDKLLTPPTGSREAYYNELISELDAAGIWSKLDFLQVYAASTFPTACVDLKGSLVGNFPGSFAVFVANSYINPQGTGATFDTGFNVSTGTNFLQNDACLFGWNLGTSSVGYDIGSGAAPENHISCRNANASNHTLWAINSASEVDSGALVSTPAGFWLANRTGSTASALYLNGASIATSSVASTTPSNGTIQFANNNTGKPALCGAGGSLTSTQITQLYNIFREYLQSIGNSV